MSRNSNTRTTTPTTIPGIPKPPGDISPALKAYLEAVSEALEVRLGRRGDPRDRAITLRELINSGLAQDLRNRPFNPNASGPNTLDFLNPDADQAVPPRPTGFSASGGYALIQLYWDYPRYGNHSQTEIWRHDSDVIGDAQLVGVAPGLAYVDAVGGGQSYYYWIRHVSTSGVPGPFNDSAGTLAETAPDVELLLEVLTGAITESQLFADLGARIDLIDAEGTGLLDRVDGLVETYGDTVSSAQSAAEAAASAAEAVAAKVAALGAESGAVAAKVAAISAQAGAETAEDAAVIAKTAAETAEANASTSETAASNSATSAAGSAASASTSATTAANAATQAGNSASAAATSETNAAGYATDSENAAAASQTSRLAAEAARDNAATSASAAATSETNAASSATDAASASSASQTARLAAEAARDNASQSASAAATSSSSAAGYATDAETASAAATSAKVSAEAARDNAATSASAAATSASSAASSATDSSESASSASTSATNAATSAGSAATSATNAATSETNAAGSANSASLSATAAANSATDAGGSATAAAGSASTASTKATEASNSASAANVARVAAESAQAGAASSASAASTSASSAATSASAAGTSATSATSSANEASSSAGAALTYRNQAAQSATDAEGFATASAQDYTAINARLDEVGGAGVTVEQAFEANASDIDGLEGKYTVKVDANGYVAGFGLAVTNNDAAPTSEFIVRADRFAIGSPSGLTEVAPFVVVTTPQVLNGVTVPTGVYIGEAFIKNGAITSAKIGVAEVDEANIADASITTAKIDDATITGAKIIDGEITTAKIGTAAVTNANIQDATITGAKIGTAEIDTLLLAGEAVIVPVADTFSGNIAASWPTVRTYLNGLPNPTITLTVTTEVLVLWGVRYLGQSSGAGDMLIRIKEGTTTIFQMGGTPAALSTGGFMGGAIRRSKTAGTYTYYMEWSAFNSPLYEAYIILLGIQR